MNECYFYDRPLNYQTENQQEINYLSSVLQEVGSSANSTATCWLARGRHTHSKLYF